MKRLITFDRVARFSTGVVLALAMWSASRVASAATDEPSKARVDERDESAVLFSREDVPLIRIEIPPAAPFFGTLKPFADKPIY